MVVAGFGACRDVYPMLKSILFYRTRPLHLHLVTDDNATTILKRLFTTWQLPKGGHESDNERFHKRCTMHSACMHALPFGDLWLLLSKAWLAGHLTAYVRMDI